MNNQLSDRLRIYVSGIQYNAVLKEREEYLNAISVLESLGLPKHPDPPKNWDSFAAFCILVENFDNKEVRILDAGGEYYSVILPHLATYGFKDLTCINLNFRSDIRNGPIIFKYGDIVNTMFENEYFSAIVCLSVIEHGIDAKSYFKETSRILKKGGILFTSTDYWNEQIDTKNQLAYGSPVKIFDQKDIGDLIRTAENYGLELVGHIDLEGKNKIIECNPIKLQYTFLYFTLRKI
jgi:SAM-dependent methyltransferase